MRTLKGRKPTIVIGDLNTILSVTGQASKIKLNKDIKDMNNIVNKCDLIHTYECGVQTQGIYIFFMNARGIFTKMSKE